MSLTPLKIIASGIALPRNKVWSSQLDQRLNKQPGYVEKHSGIEYRYHAKDNDSQAILAAEALHNTLSAQHIAPSSIDLLISASAIAVQACPVRQHIFLPFQICQLALPASILIPVV